MFGLLLMENLGPRPLKIAQSGNDVCDLGLKIVRLGRSGHAAFLELYLKNSESTRNCQIPQSMSYFTEECSYTMLK